MFQAQLLLLGCMGRVHTLCFQSQMELPELGSAEYYERSFHAGNETPSTCEDTKSSIYLGSMIASLERSVEYFGQIISVQTGGEQYLASPFVIYNLNNLYIICLFIKLKQKYQYIKDWKFSLIYNCKNVNGTNQLQ